MSYAEKLDSVKTRTRTRNHLLFLCSISNELFHKRQFNFRRNESLATALQEQGFSEYRSLDEYL